MTGHLVLVAGTGAVVALVIWFAVIPLGLRGVFEALGAARSRAWVPFVNLATVYRLGGMSEYWLVVLVIPPATVLGMVMLFVASHRIARKLGRSGWFTVLAVVQWWIWTLVIGLHHARERPSGSEPLVWTVRRPETALRLPPEDDATPSASSPLVDPIIAARSAGIDAPSAPLAAEPPSAPPAPLAAEAPSAPLVAEPPPAPRVVPAARIETPPMQPTIPLPHFDFPAAPPVPAPPMPPELPSFDEPVGEASVPPPPRLEPDDEATILGHVAIDQTVISPRRRPRWSLHTTMGSRIELLGTSAILGRRPREHPLYPGAQLVMVTDDATSVSATHAVLEYVDGEWQVTDLGSTNGVWLVDPATGEESELGAHRRRRVTPHFMLGELGVQVVRNA